GIGQQLVVLGRPAAAGLGPALQITQLDPQDGPLEGLHAIVIALQDVVVLPLRAPVAEHADHAVGLGAVGEDRASLAVSSEVLAGVEAEAGQVTEAADPVPFVLGAVSLGGIFDDDQTAAA